MVIKVNSMGDLTNDFPFNYLAGLAELPFPSALGIKGTQEFRVLTVLLNVEGTRNSFRELTLIVCLMIAKSRCEVRGNSFRCTEKDPFLNARMTISARNDAMRKRKLVFKTLLYTCNSGSCELRALTGN